MTYDFTTVTEVRLGQGAHEEPKHGMCFMEMVAWFANEEHSDTPTCACSILGSYGMRLNDAMPSDLRDELLKPLIPMIAGTVGTADDQQKRGQFLAIWSVTKVLPIALRAIGLEDHAHACATAADLSAAYAAADAARAAARAAAYAAADAADAYAADAAAYADAADAYAARAAAYAAADAADAYAARAAAYAAARAAAYAADAYAAADAADAYARAAAYAAADAADAAADAADAADAAADARREVFTIAVEGLRQAIMIGPHAGFDQLIDIAKRHAALRELVAA